MNTNVLRGNKVPRWCYNGAALPRVRVVYAFLSIFDSGDYPFYESKWSYFKGSLVAYIIMGLLMEYVVACIYIFVGMTTRLLKESNGGNN